MMLPRNTDFKGWADSLIVDFPLDNIPAFREGEDWKRFGNVVSGLTSFANNGVPGTSGFSEPMAWAAAVFKQMVNTA